MQPDLARHARAQAGVFSRAQALAAGYTHATIRRRVGNGEWLAVHPDVFRHVSSRTSTDSTLHAAVLHCGPTGVLSHASAAFVIRLPGAWTVRPVHVSVRRNVRARRKGLTTHRYDDVPPFGLYNGHRVTSAARTVVDLALGLSGTARVAFLDKVLQHNIVMLEQVYDEAESAKGRRGVAGLVRDIAGVDPDLASHAEVAFAEALCDAGVEPGVAEFVVVDADGFVARVDRAWASEGVLAEVDGFAWHKSSERFRHDRVRHNRLVNAGWVVLRFAALEVLERPAQVAAAVARALGAAREGKRAAGTG